MKGLTVKKSVVGTIVCLGALLVSQSSWSHHSPAMFDEQQRISIEGVVKEFQYTNPHSWLIVEVTAEDGSVTTWGVEGLAPTALLRAGLRKSDFPPGTRVSIVGHPLKDGRPAMAGLTATRADGETFNLRPNRSVEDVNTIVE